MAKKVLTGELDHDLLSHAKVVKVKVKTTLDVAKEKAAAKAATKPKPKAGKKK